MPYSVTPWINNSVPAMNATNLNKLKNELASQAATQSIAHTLPTWANGVAPALTDPAPLNEMERVAAAVATSVGLSYTVTFWQNGWVPARNAANLNKLEAQVSANRAAMDPPPPDLLRWTPPVLGAGGTAIVDFTLTDATRNSATLGSGAGRDLRVTQTGIVTSGGMAQMTGWRHIEWIGGHFNIGGSGENTIIIPRDCSGTVHLEGIKVEGTGVLDAIVIRLGIGSSQRVQIQNCNLAVDWKGTAAHADCFQSQEGRINFLGFDKCTLTTDYQGIFLRNGSPSSFINGGELHRVNFKRLGVDPSTFFWITDTGDGTTDAQTGGPVIGPFTLDDVWMEPTASPGRDIYPNSIFEYWFTSGTATDRRGNFVLTDVNGTYVRPSTTSDTVPGGGPKSGQSALSAGWTGTIRSANPPDGDFCPIALPGITYQTPGYV